MHFFACAQYEIKDSLIYQNFKLFSCTNSSELKINHNFLQFHNDHTFLHTNN